MKNLSMLCAAIALTATTNAQWVRTHGPGGGSISAMASDGSDVLASAGRGGVFFSGDLGGSWSEANNGLEGRMVTTMAMSGGMAYAGTDEGELYVTSNDGGSWAVLNDTFTDSSITAIVVVGSNIFVAAFGDGVFRSTDGGANWASVTSGLNDMSVTSLVRSGTMLYAGSDGGGVFLSSDQGDTWAPINNGLNGLNVRSLAVTGTTIFAGTYAYDGPGGIYRSLDAGNSWTQLITGYTEEQFIVRLVADATTVLAMIQGPFIGSYPNVIVSNDGGDSWTSACTGGLMPCDVRSAVISGSTLLGGTAGGGVFVSTDAGVTWDASNTGLAAGSVPDLILSGDHLVAHVSYGPLARSGDQGDTWNAPTVGLISHTAVDFAQSGDTLFAGTIFSYGWGGFAALSISTDEGDTWDVVDTLPFWVNSIEVLDGILFAVDQSQGMHRSTDGGLSWSLINNGLPDAGTAYPWLLGTSGQRLFAGVEGGDVYVSTDHGDSWSLSVASGTYTQARSFAAKGDTILVGYDNTYSGSGAIKISTNGGQNWTSLNTGLANPRTFALLAVGDHFVAGTVEGVFVLNEALTAWVDINTGIQYPAAWVLAADHTYLYAGVPGCGVWRRSLSELFLTIAEPLAAQVPLVYPNPATDRLTVVCEGTPGTGTTVRIRSADGKLVHQALGMGRSMLEVDTRLFPEGVYAVSLQQGNLTRTAKCIIVH